MGTMVDISNAMLAIMGGIFLVVVMVVLWNMGLMNGLRRYGEVGLRLAIGEPKGHVYRSLIANMSRAVDWGVSRYSAVILWCKQNHF